MKIISIEKMKELETAANSGGYSYEKMMLNAGNNLARVVHERFFNEGLTHAFGIVGGGNNGGDTLIALIELENLGWNCSAWIAKNDQEWMELIRKFESSGGKVIRPEHLSEALQDSQLVLDGVFGTGFHSPMRNEYTKLFTTLAKFRRGRVFIAVDCPSGVDCVSGQVSPLTVKADLTVSMEAVKEGMLKLPAFEYCGEIVTVDLGIPANYKKDFEGDDFVIDHSLVLDSMKKRDPDSHKGDFGHLIVCGGCVNYPGAPKLSAKCAYRVGCGLVEMAVPERIYEAVVADNVESIFTLLEDEDGVIADGAASTLFAHLEKSTCLLVGPGIGREETTQRFFQRLVNTEFGKLKVSTGFLPVRDTNHTKVSETLPPMVIDADALRLLANIPDWHKRLGTKVVLTPHPGEMAALTGITTSEIQTDRIGIARKYAQLWHQVVVLKGALTLVASPDGKVAVLPFANSILAKAGTGDVLAGIIAGLIAQGVEVYKAAWMGTWIHAQAAKQVEDNQGCDNALLAGDLVNALPQVFGLLKQD